MQSRSSTTLVIGIDHGRHHRVIAGGRRRRIDNPVVTYSHCQSDRIGCYRDRLLRAVVFKRGIGNRHSRGRFANSIGNRAGGTVVIGAAVKTPSRSISAGQSLRRARQVKAGRKVGTFHTGRCASRRVRQAVVSDVIRSNIDGRVGFGNRIGDRAALVGIVGATPEIPGRSVSAGIGLCRGVKFKLGRQVFAIRSGSRAGRGVGSAVVSNIIRRDNNGHARLADSDRNSGARSDVIIIVGCFGRSDRARAFSHGNGHRAG